MTWNTIFLFVCAAVLAYGTLEVASQSVFRNIFSKQNKCKRWPFPSHKQLEYAMTVTARLRKIDPPANSLGHTTWAWDFGMGKAQLKRYGSHIFLYDEKGNLWHMERRDESEILDGCVSRAWKVLDSLNDWIERDTPFAAKLLNINAAEKKRKIPYTHEVEALDAFNRLEAHSILSHPWPEDPRKIGVVKCQDPHDFDVEKSRCSEGATAAIVYKRTPGKPLSKLGKVENSIFTALAKTVFESYRNLHIALWQITAGNMMVYQDENTWSYQVAPADLSMAINLQKVPAEWASRLKERTYRVMQELVEGLKGAKGHREL